MRPVIQMHWVAALELGAIRVFAENPPVRAFAVRDVTVRQADGESFSFEVYGRTRADLLTDAEVEVARLQEEVDALRDELARLRPPPVPAIAWPPRDGAQFVPPEQYEPNTEQPPPRGGLTAADLAEAALHDPIQARGCTSSSSDAGRG